MPQSNKEIILQFLTTLANVVKANIPSVTGKTAQSIEVVAEENEGSILAAKYIGVLVDGRKPGTMPPVRSILEYVKSKSLLSKIGWNGTESSLAWAISIKMKREGNTLYRALHGGEINYSPFRLEVDRILSQSRIDAFAETFAGKYQSLISSEVIQAYKQ